MNSIKDITSYVGAIKNKSDTTIGTLVSITPIKGYSSRYSEPTNAITINVVKDILCDVKYIYLLSNV